MKTVVVYVVVAIKYIKRMVFSLHAVRKIVSQLQIVRYLAKPLFWSMFKVKMLKSLLDLAQIKTIDEIFKRLSITLCII